MKTLASLVAVVVFATFSFSQEKSNDQINRQIHSLNVDHVNISFDASSNISKLMAVAENFSNQEADSAGLQAINFALGFFYSGQSLKNSPETVHFSFWVLTKKPRFADNHHLTVEADGRTIDLGDARYAAKPDRNLEYLNFDPSRADLAIIGSATRVIFRLGNHTFTAAPSQLKLINTTARIADLSQTY